VSRIFNPENGGWKAGQYALFMGQNPALHDSINVSAPAIQALALRQVSQRWVFDEFNHDQSRLDLTTCPESIYKVMLMNIAYQWEADSVASRAIAPLLAPFVTNSELWEALLENTNMEVTHAKTYSNIVQQCVPNPGEVFSMVMENERTLKRAETVNVVFDELAVMGALKTLKESGLTGFRVMGDDVYYGAIMRGIWALYALERIQFMSSFAATFAIVEQGYFQSIGKAVQKIMLDELFCHAALDREILKVEMATERGKAWLEANRDWVKMMLDEVVEQETSWAPYLLGDGRSIVGYTPQLAAEWTAWNAKECYTLAGVEPALPAPSRNPLPWMDNWIDVNKTQNAQQEADGNNYALNVVKDDLGSDVIDF